MSPNWAVYRKGLISQSLFDANESKTRSRKYSIKKYIGGINISLTEKDIIQNDDELCLLLLAGSVGLDDVRVTWIRYGQATNSEIFT